MVPPGLESHLSTRVSDGDQAIQKRRIQRQAVAKRSALKLRRVEPLTTSNMVGSEAPTGGANFDTGPGEGRHDRSGHADPKDAPRIQA